ncbi:MAG: DUF3870 domain-containing protein [Anaeromicrobium sp.]|jgi:hypothetical protein|uniref:DUF3870 domain-containing protein n=1 Tax=Anaeromicrobium sp. TaxID=1929132 RepID=UPI0025FC8664|nr:DUF3870 domain-containing protein [Anaeromicrobium sp.]MCT4592761.1 DUF3870 domain-containing protein [Anaeromicrobium sp.]
MDQYSSNSVYFISYAKLPTDISAAHVHKVVGLGMIINPDTQIIEDVSCTLLTQEAKSFLKTIFVGYDLEKDGIDNLLEKIKSRYHGMAQKALCVAAKSTYLKYLEWKKNSY